MRFFTELNPANVWLWLSVIIEDARNTGLIVNFFRSITSGFCGLAQPALLVLDGYFLVGERQLAANPQTVIRHEHEVLL